MTRLRSVGRYAVEDQTIGKGNFAVVELATHSVTKTKVALKVIEKRKISKPYVKKNLTREARILSQLRHPNIVRLYETITSPQLYCLVMEYVPGGDLLTLVRGQKGGRLKEGVARRFVRQLVSALHHMHEHGIVHRDLKMENIMMDKKRKNVKIIDFGLSNQCGPDELFKTHCGSPEYAAPELYVAGRDYGPEVDIWSLGVNMFAMVTGKLPFTTPHSENRRQHLLLQIRNGLKGVHAKEMAHLTDDCKDMLHGCLEPIPEDRLPLLDIERHAWITCEGQEPFCPFQAPPQDLDLRAEVIEDMALRLKVSPEKIQDVVQENRLDDVSAIFNILMEEYLIKRGVSTSDHTRPPTPQTPTETEIALPRSGRRECSRAPSNGPGSAYADSSDGVCTPSVVTMVRPSLKSPERKNTKVVDFELDVVEAKQAAWAERTGMQPGLPPPWTKKTRPLGNATTVNRIKARTSYRTGSPGTSDQKYTYARTDLLHASTVHILVPTPSVESQPTSQTEMDVGNSPSEPRSTSQAKSDAKTGRASGGGSVKQKTFKPITNVKIFFGSTLESANGPKKEQKRALKEKPISSAADRTFDEAREVKPVVHVVDMSNNLTGKHHSYHGYRLGETPISTEDETSEATSCSKPAESGKDKGKEVRLCVAHREFLQDGLKSSCGRPAATPYSTPRTRNGHNEMLLTARRYPPTPESDEHTQSDDATTPKPMPLSKRIPRRYNSTLKNRERSTADSATTASSSSVPSPRSLLHPSIATIHGRKETASILSNFAVLQGSDNAVDTLSKLPKKHASLKKNDHEKKMEEKEKKNAVGKSPEPRVCKRTTVELTNNEVRGRNFKMFNEMPQRAIQKRSIRRSPDHSSKQTPNIQHRDCRSARVNARILQSDNAPSKFIQKFGANRLSQSNKDGHRYCRVPTFGYTKDNFPGHAPSSPNRMRSPTATSRSTSPLRRVVDISEQAMNSLVNEALREKKSSLDDSGGDIVKSVQRHFNERLKAQRRSPGYEMYTRFVPIQVCGETGKEKGMILPSTGPAPQLKAPKETVFNILETLPSHPFPTPPPPSSSAPPPVDKAGSPSGIGRAATTTGISGRNAVSPSDANRATSGVEEWDATYRLERKISDTVKGAAYVRNMKNEQRTRAWVADTASEYATKIMSEQ